jgi:hypothetical protein
MTDLKVELHGKLRTSRALILSKLDGLSERDMRRPMTASGTNLLGLVKHLVGVEQVYLGEAVGRAAPDVLPWVADGSIWDGADMWATADESSSWIVELYRRACTHSDASIAALTVESPAEVPHWPEERRSTTLGVLLIRMVDETAQHAGHADIVRELIDGRGGGDHDQLGNETAWRATIARIRAAADAFPETATSSDPG